MMYPHLIDIVSVESTDDGAGGQSQNVIPFLTNVEAHVQPISGSEYYQSQQLKNPVQVDVFTPYNGAINSGMQVIYNENTLTIQSVLDQGGMNQVLLLKCSYFQ